MLNAAVEDWPLFEAIDRRRSLLHKDGRPATYDELVAIAPPSLQAELAPEKLGKRHAGAMAALGRLHDGLIGAKLDALVVIGDDHKELYHDDNMPSILVYRGETIANVPNRTRTPAHIGAGPPDWMKRAVARYYEESETRHYPVQAGLANHLIASLIDREFDVAAANALPEGEGEGHAFAFVHRRLMNGVTIPVVPVVLNTYYPPNQPSPRRCYRLGQAIRAAIEGYPESLRVGVVASGGLSHFTVDEALDGELIRALREKDAPALEACRASSSIPETPRSATGSAPPVRSSISISAGSTTSPAIAPRRERARACASPVGRDDDPRRLALDVGVLRIGELAARKRNQHGRVLAVAAILVAELLDQVALFQLDADQDVAGDHHREQQMTNGHRRRGPDGEQDAEIDRMTDTPVEQRSAEFRVRQLFAEQAREHLAEPEQLEMTDQKRAGHQHDPAQPEDASSTAAAAGLSTVQTGAGMGCHCQYRISSTKLANST